MAAAAALTVTEARRIVPLGSIDPHLVVTPGIFVDRVGGGKLRMSKVDRDVIAWRAAQDIPNGSYVNLGIGIPTLVPRFVPGDREIIYQSENGLLGIGPPPQPGEEDGDLINASKDPVTLVPGAAVFDSALAFGMMRGGHLNLALLGAFEVDAEGSIANWTLDRSNAPPGVGGAMDLAVGAREIWVLMEHTDRGDAPRIRERCALALTARGVARRIYTDLAVITVEPGRTLVVHEIDPELSPDELAKRTDARLTFSPGLRPLRQPERGALAREARDLA